MDRQQPAGLRKPLTAAQRRARAAWVFCSLLLASLIAVVILDRDHFVGVSQPILAVFAGLLAGLMTFFLTGELHVNLPWLKGTGGLGVFVLVLLLWPKLMPSPGLYRVRVTVLGPQGEMVEKASLTSAPSGDKKEVDGGWELDIPAGSLPESHKLTLYARHPATSSQAIRELTLGKDFQPTIEIRLPAIFAMVHGRVLDQAGGPLSGALVSVRGFEGEGVRTGPGGEFTLASHATPGTMVWLRAEREDFHSTEQDHPAGNGTATIQLQRQRR